MYANAINVRTLVMAAAVAMLVALGSAGIAYANGGDDSEEQLTGPDAQKAKSAAIAAVGGGTVSEGDSEVSHRRWRGTRPPLQARRSA